MRLSELGGEAEAAARLMAEAARLAGIIQVNTAGRATKADESPVTLVDFGVQAVVARRLAAAFPDDSLVAEEDASALRDPAAAALLARVVEAARRAEPGVEAAELLDAIDRGRGEPGPRFWTLDPVDGTKGLLRGGQFVVALALVVDGRVEVGAIGCPRLSLPAGGNAEGGVGVAVRGQGSWWMPLAGDDLSPLHVSAVTGASHARIAHSAEESHSDTSRLDALRRALAIQARPVLMDSQAKHVMVAAGETDLLFRFPRAGYKEAIWDQAAGTLLIEEAGGRITDLSGRPFDFSTGRRMTANDGVVASNGRLHQAVLDALARGPRA
ncbi:MAG: 3'(2'),5'-bisphosphate nucleotidase [Acidobacteria bacterium]|nr:3'(2'),5'-bisphosphate nucleotidase [Acidobacteriota bacterium]